MYLLIQIKRGEDMPPVKVHFDMSKERTGNDFKELHEWMDLQEKPKKHDLDRLGENLEHVGTRFGIAGTYEFMKHLLDDVEHKMAKTRKAYYIQVLKDAGVPEGAIEHSRAVAEKAMEIADRVKINVDKMLIEQGAIFHDLGKARTLDIEHGKIGAEIAAKLGTAPQVIAIVEKHIRGGMSGREAEELGLPVKDYSLKTPEEKIAIYSDRLVDMIQDKVADDEDAELKFEEILRKYQKYGKNPKTMERYIGLHREIHGWMKM
jgi:uncharacterized protein